MLPVKALIPQAMEIQFTTRILKEGRTFVAHALELDVSSCGGSKEKALRNLKEAVRLFLEEAGKMDTLEQILESPRALRDDVESQESQASRDGVERKVGDESRRRHRGNVAA